MRCVLEAPRQLYVKPMQMMSDTTLHARRDRPSGREVRESRPRSIDDLMGGAGPGRSPVDRGLPGRSAGRVLQQPVPVVRACVREGRPAIGPCLCPLVDQCMRSCTPISRALT